MGRMLIPPSITGHIEVLTPRSIARYIEGQRNKAWDTV